MDLQRFSALTFDCYGTLIDWESGILEALAPLRRQSWRKVEDEELLARYAAAESRAQGGEYKRYREVLAEVGGELAAFLEVPLGRGDGGFLAESIAEWRPFADTVPALEKLSGHFQLSIVSNVDDDLFAHSAGWLRVDFDPVITAEQVGSYKPSHDNFLRACEQIGLPREKILHVAQSLYHDVKPATELGLSTVWVNRRHGKSDPGATPPAAATPTLEVPDLATLAALV